MTKLTAVIASALIHVVPRITIFWKPIYKDCYPQTTISSWIFLLSVLEILWDNEFIPYRFKIFPRFFLWLVEVFTGVFLVEFGMIMIWSNFEDLIVRLLRFVIVTTAPKYEHPIGDVFIESCTILLCLCLLYNISKATDIVFRLKQSCFLFTNELRGRTSCIFASRSWINRFHEVSSTLTDSSSDAEDGLSSSSHRNRKTSRKSPRLPNRNGKNHGVKNEKR